MGLNKTASQLKLKNQNHPNSLINLKYKQTLIRSKNPNDHQLYLNILQMK